MASFIKNIEELSYLSSQKVNLTTNLKKNYKENIHYIIKKNKYKNENKNGGQNKIDYLLTEDAFELFKNSFNLRNKYIIDIKDNIKQINLCMCIENQTIGFIENSYKDVVNMKRQYMIGKYKIDLYFIDYKLAIECDEFNHKDRDISKELIREEYIKSQGSKIIRYNPNEKDFDLSNILKEINKILFFNKIL